MVTKEQVIEKLKTVEDPELFLDIWFLGLVYNIELDPDAPARVGVEMTFTTPMCPAGPSIVEDVRGALNDLEGIEEVSVNVVFDPPWEPSDDVKALLGMM